MDGRGHVVMALEARINDRGCVRTAVTHEFATRLSFTVIGEAGGAPVFRFSCGNGFGFAIGSGFGFAVGIDFGGIRGCLCEGVSVERIGRNVRGLGAGLDLFLSDHNRWFWLLNGGLGRGRLFFRNFWWLDGIVVGLFLYEGGVVLLGAGHSLGLEIVGTGDGVGVWKACESVRSSVGTCVGVLVLKLQVADLLLVYKLKTGSLAVKLVRSEERLRGRGCLK